ncbi:PLP-dependent aminotransferase family protein [Neobacillus niacini]|uniref:MocR-like pyridoxine biosynthesis transcription factor PdxR n=1 Tax=Neobacillus niacini TaxID=86668 RepID=UPI002867934F|nr:PLP-dependent aminotransferase family protein [Neobacillus niacini]MDR6999190.1 GntR family transcriptional regulator/MocR family aminotransferase [Neobacillus niacini]
MDMLMFKLDKSAAKPLYEQLYTGIKDAIIQKQIEVGTKLPSKKKLAEFLNISQTTIEIAYAQLIAEGYVGSKPRIGFFVEEIDELPYIEKGLLNMPVEMVEKKIYQFDFHPGKIDTDSFPFSLWRKYAKNLYDNSSKEFLQIGDPQGEFALRAEISKYLYQSRGIVCKSEQIVIGSGTEHLLPMILRLLENDSKFALENPGYSAIPKIQLQDKAISIPVDEDGLMVDELERTNANVVYITPSHQFPTGAVLSATRRTHLLNWAAKDENRYIIEDDYDSEFRYIGKPIPALHGLDQNNKVIYMSTFSKSLMPSLRVAYIVLPSTLLRKYKEIFSFYSATVPRFDQHILANFMRDGHFSKHLNRMRKIYRKKHEKLTQIFETYYPDVIITGDQAGMHILISVPLSKSEDQLKQMAKKNNIAIYPVSDYLLSPIEYKYPTFLFGFGSIPFDQIEKGIHQLMQCWGISKSKKR